MTDTSPARVPAAAELQRRDDGTCLIASRYDEPAHTIAVSGVANREIRLAVLATESYVDSLAMLMAVVESSLMADAETTLAYLDQVRWEHRGVMPPPALTITVHGEPAPQGSKRHVGGGRMIESSTKVKPWREAVKHASLASVFPDDGEGGTWKSLDGPLSVEVVFTLRKPTTAPKRRITWPSKKPDLDKLVRSTFDALSDAGIWRDDAQAVELHATKVYPGEGVDALPHPGAVIRITPIGGA
jgi:Holliday junction resolvase RusA-like endonuclease